VIAFTRGSSYPAVLAFHHTRPFWRNHIVIVPKRHIASFTTVTSADEEVMRRLY
jgi:histidine triad (HIT) family protein